MREIVDRHFSDNWVIAQYMGFTVELPHVWESYKAARAALANTTQQSNVKALHLYYHERLAQSRKMLQHYLTEGVLTDEFALDNTPALLHCVRECNVTIRWLMHRPGLTTCVPRRPCCLGVRATRTGPVRAVRCLRRRAACPRGPHALYVRRTRTSLGRAVGTAYHGTPGPPLGAGWSPACRGASGSTAPRATAGCPTAPTRRGRRSSFCCCS